MTSIFVAYRRDDCRDQAQRLLDHLIRHFGKNSVFDDLDSIPSGSDFHEVLAERVAGCDVVLAVIGDGWLSAAGSTGMRRIDDPGEFARIGIGAALARYIEVIPVLVGRSSVPKAEDLPASLRELSNRRGALLRPDPDWHNDMDRLIQRIQALPRKPVMSPPANPDPNPGFSYTALRNLRPSKPVAWALLAGFLLVAALLLFRRNDSGVDVASSPEINESQVTKTQNTPKSSVKKASKPAPEIATKPPGGEVGKPSRSPSPVAAKVEKNTAAIQSLIDAGLSLVAADDLENATTKFDEAIRLDPGNAEAHAGRAFASGNNTSGLAEADEAVHLNPKSALAHAARGNFLLRGASSHDYPGAIAACNEALRLDPNLALVHAVRSDLYLRRYSLEGRNSSDIDMAIGEGSKAIRLDPNLFRAYIHRSNALTAKGRFDDAMKDVEQALRISPQSAKPYNARAQIWHARKNYTRAIADFTKAIQVKSNYIHSYQLRAESFEAMGNKARAKADREQAQRLQREKNP